MKTLGLEKICTDAADLIKIVALYIKSETGQVTEDKIEHKSFNSLVSHVDQNAEKMLINGLQSIVPGSGIIAEESEHADADAESVWIIDPLDGTTNFLHGIPFFAISVALTVRGKCVIGIVYDVIHDQCFYAWDEGGAYMNDQKISVSRHSELSNCLAATGFPYYDYTPIESYIRCLRYFMKKTRGIRRIGSAALDLAYVACGRFDFFFEYGLNNWDIAAGSILVKEAGGTVTDINGGDNYLCNGSILASNGFVHQKTLHIIKPEFLSYI
ncbi:MAG TPA: inositol monophosphatase family protein [Saprospiraceae bacterium]|jgi:myo-inositol-1(or 4)-monophosphatase|nr:inositol monophosphatase [Saprospiraceae bacterium]MCC6687656.1 inositol monophosphatase [Saprospiraceae bacterium]HMV23462.1 inositol monophosphatase family protein [Saprospiraceae bacterium]HMW74714.1 inositol monophosphatase family protein [Saprospiraceae bacterium]HMX82512.1 inositol monophosphatase family protein [Saprospiraceae bacterium]